MKTFIKNLIFASSLAIIGIVNIGVAMAAGCPCPKNTHAKACPCPKDCSTAKGCPNCTEECDNAQACSSCTEDCPSLSQVCRTPAVICPPICPVNTPCDEVHPYLGAEYQHLFLRGRNHLWQPILPKSYPGLSVYIGARFLEAFGFELGYSFSTSNSKKLSTTVNGFTITGQRISRFNSFYLDLLGFWSFYPCWELFGAVGIANMQPNLSFSGIRLTPASATAVAGLSTIRGRSSLIARIGAGVNYMINDMLGARASIRWENTRQLRIHGDARFVSPINATTVALGRRPFSDSVSLALGLFVKF